MSLFKRFRKFDVYTKPIDDCRVKTSFGGLITLISYTVIIILFITETISFMSVEIVEQLYVDSTNSDMRVDINFDITFNKLSCYYVTVDVMENSGESQNDIEHDISKQRLDSTGQIIVGTEPEKQVVNTNSKNEGTNKTGEDPEKAGLLKCGSCYGANDEGCCNTCAEVKEAYRLRGWQLGDPNRIEQCKDEGLNDDNYKGEGCRIYGKVDVGKYLGNFHIAPGKPTTNQHSHYHEFQKLSPGLFDTSHTINHLSFGKAFPGKSYPLDGKHFKGDKGGIMHQYILKVVPTTYVFASLPKSSNNSTGENINEQISHQFAITRTQKDVLGGHPGGIPGVFVQYEFSPLMVRYEEKQKSISNFIVSLCAIIGGVFTVASLVDSFIYSSSKVMQRKFQIGKAS